MKRKFSSKWKASKQPRKQRKYRANAPLHISRKFLSANLSKILRGKYGRSVSIRRGDVVKIMRGQFKGKKGKVTVIQMKKGRVAVEGIQRSKKDGTKINIFFNCSNLQIQELNLDDKKRLKRKRGKVRDEKQEKKVEKVKKTGEKNVSKKK
jgi:large subunit ribosomal protein L24